MPAHRNDDGAPTQISAALRTARRASRNHQWARAMHLPTLMRRSRKRVLAALAFVVAALVVVLISLNHGAESRALERMSPETRAQLYRETLAATRTLCEVSRTDDALRDRCSSSAEFLLDFPECDDTCHTFATPLTSEHVKGTR